MLTDDYGYQTKELRILPSGGDSNILCGKQGYEREMRYRQERNKELGDAFKFKLPKWEDLRIYQSEEVSNER